MMKLLFLDVDGVLWTVGGCILAKSVHGKDASFRHELDPVAVACSQTCSASTRT
jgi:hypothetical protein